MEKLPEQAEIITLLRAKAKEKGLSYDKIVAMLPNDQKKISKSTIQRVLSAEDPATLNCEYNTLFAMGDILIDNSDIAGRSLLLHYKRHVIEALELENIMLKERLEHDGFLYKDIAATRSNQMQIKDLRIDRLLDLIDKKENQIEALLRQLLTKCNDCPLRREAAHRDH